MEVEPDLAAAAVSQAAADRAVEVEEQGALRGVEAVVGVRQVEDLEDRFEGDAAAEG